MTPRPVLLFLRDAKKIFKKSVLLIKHEKREMRKVKRKFQIIKKTKSNKILNIISE